MGWYSRWRAKRKAKKGGYVSYDLDKGTATYVSKPGEATQSTVPPKVASVRSIDYVGGGSKTITTEGIGYTGGGGTTSRTTTRTSPTGVRTTTTEDLRQKQFTIPESLTRDITTQQSLREIYNPRTGTYQTSPYGTGAGGTAYERPPTYDEQRRIDIAQEKGKLSELPPLKFLAGEYEWQKKLDNRTGVNKTRQATFGEGYTQKELYEVGGYPTMVRKGFSDIFGGGSVWASEKITGQEMSPQVKQQVKNAIGTLFLFAGFSQAMRTGTYSESISKQLSKNKFDKLKELLNKAESQIAEQKTLADQAKILKQIKDGLKTPEQIKNYNLWVKSLKDKGIFHEVKVDTSKVGSYSPPKSSVTGEIVVDMPQNIPTGKIGGTIGIDVRKVRDVNWVGSDTKTTQGQSPYALNIFEDVQQTKTSSSSRNILGLKDIQETKTKIKQTEIQKQESIQKIKQTARQKQAQRTGQTYFSSLISKLRQAQGQKSSQLLQPRLKEETKFKPPFKLGDAIKRAGKMAKEKPDEFRIFFKRFGKDIEVMKTFGTKEKAKEKLGQILKGTLARSGFVTKKGEKLGFKELGFGEMFRPAKRDTKRIVQKAKYSLSAPSEVSEIQFFKKKSKGKKKKKSSKYDWFS